MSTEEQTPEVPAEETTAEETTVETTEPEDDTPKPRQRMDIMEALQIVLKKALIHDGLARGLRESVKALDRQTGHLCILAGNVTDALYTDLITALCDNSNVQLVKVQDNKQLGEWVGLCKIDAEGQARKVVKCSSCVITNYGEQSDALEDLLAHIEES